MTGIRRVIAVLGACLVAASVLAVHEFYGGNYHGRGSLRSFGRSLGVGSMVYEDAR